MNTSFGSGTFSTNRAAFSSASAGSPQFRAASHPQQHAVKFGFNSALMPGDEEEPQQQPRRRTLVEALKAKFKKS